jgi:uncharacterized protein with PIN domain
MFTAGIKLRFNESLNDFVRPALRHIEISHVLERKASIKDVIESFNVPHTEIELILVNGSAVDFSHIVQDGDDIQVYPTRQTLNSAELPLLRPPLLQPPKFIIDVNLGKLARNLRLLGIDCWYHNDYADDDIARLSSEEQRILLTRDRSLLRRKIIIYGYYVRADSPMTQTKEVLSKFDLYSLLKPLTRCTHCNGEFRGTDKTTIEHRLEPLTKQHYQHFLMCSHCQQIYWQGSHHARLRGLIEELSTR